MVKTRKMVSLHIVTHSRVTRSSVKGQGLKITRNQVLRKTNNSNNHISHVKQMEKVQEYTKSQLKSKSQLCKSHVSVPETDNQETIANETAFPETCTVNQEMVSDKTVQVMAHDQDQKADNQDALHGEKVGQLGTVNQDTCVAHYKTLKVMDAKSADQKSSVDEDIMQDSISQEMINQDTADNEIQKTVNQKAVSQEIITVPVQAKVDVEKVVQEMVIQGTVNQKTVSQETVPVPVPVQEKVDVEKVMHADQETSTELVGDQESVEAMTSTDGAKTKETTGDDMVSDSIPIEGSNKEVARSEDARVSENYVDEESDEVEPLPDYIREATCTICNKELSSRYSLKVHMTAIHNPTRKKKKPTFNCPFCCKVLSNCYIYRTHIRKFHTEYQDVSVETEDLERKHGHEVSFGHTLVIGNKYSASSESEANGFQSRRGKCNVTVQTSSYDHDMGDNGDTSVLRDSNQEAGMTPLASQIEINQPQQRKQKGTSKTVKQPSKEETVVNKKSGTVILKHAKVTLKLNTGLSGETPVEGIGVDCPFCDKVCDSFAQYRNHLRSHEKKTTQCMECGAKFRRKGSLEVHMRIHTNERPYKCEICDATFRHDSSLTFHMRKHRNERNYKCLKCGQTFLSNTCMRKHMRKKCFRGKQLCSKCNKEFKCKVTLQKHMLEEHYGRTRRLVLETFPCDECNRLFSSEYSFYRHKSASHGLERPYGCLECHQTYPDMNAAKRHSLEAHYRAAEVAENYIEDRRVSKDQEEETEVEVEVEVDKSEEEEEEDTTEPEDDTGDPDYLPSAESAEEDSNMDAKSNSDDEESEDPGVVIATVHSIADPYLQKYLEAVKPVVIRKTLPQNATKLEKVLAKYPVLMPRPTLSGSFGQTVGALGKDRLNDDGCIREGEEISLMGNQRTLATVAASDSLEEVAVIEASAGSSIPEDRLQQPKEIDSPNETSTSKLGGSDIRRPSVTVTVNGASYTLPLIVTEEEILATATKTPLKPQKVYKTKSLTEKLKTKPFPLVRKVVDCGNKRSRSSDDKEPEIVLQKQQNNPEREKLRVVLQKRQKNSESTLPKSIPYELQKSNEVTESLPWKQPHPSTTSIRRRKTGNFGQSFASKSSLTEGRTPLSKATDTRKRKDLCASNESRQSKVEKLLAKLPVLIPKPVNPLVIGNTNLQPLIVSDASTVGNQHQLPDEQSVLSSSINTSPNAFPRGDRLQSLSVEGNHIPSPTLTGSSALMNQVQLLMEHCRLSPSENTDESSLRNQSQSSVPDHEENVSIESCPTTCQTSNVKDNHMAVVPDLLHPGSNYEKSMRKAVEVSRTRFYSKSNFQPVTDKTCQPANAAQSCTVSSPASILAIDVCDYKASENVTQYVESNNEEELPLIITNVISLNPNVRENAMSGNIQGQKEEIGEAGKREVVLSEDIGMSATSYETKVSEVRKTGKSSDPLLPHKPLQPTQITIKSGDSVPLRSGLAEEASRNCPQVPLRDVIGTRQNSVLGKTEMDLHNSVQEACSKLEVNLQSPVALPSDECRSSFNNDTILHSSEPEQILQCSPVLSSGNHMSNKQNNIFKHVVTTQRSLLSDRAQSTSHYSVNHPLRNTNSNLRNFTPSCVDKIKIPGSSPRRGQKSVAQWNLSRRYRPLLPKPSLVDGHRIPAFNNSPFREQVQEYPYSVRDSYLDNRTAEMIRSQMYSYRRDGEPFSVETGRHIHQMNLEEVSPHEHVASASQSTGIIHSDSGIRVSSECMESTVQPFPYISQQNRDLVQHGSTQQYTRGFKSGAPSSVSNIGAPLKSGKPSFSRSSATTVQIPLTRSTAAVTNNQDQTQAREPGDHPDSQPLSGTLRDLHKHLPASPLEKTKLGKSAQSQKYSASPSNGKNIITKTLTPQGYVVLGDSAQETAPAQHENALTVATVEEEVSQEEFATVASCNHQVLSNCGGRSHAASVNSEDQVPTLSPNSHSETSDESGEVSRVSVNNHKQALGASGNSNVSDRCGYGPPDYPSHRESLPPATRPHQSVYERAEHIAPGHTSTRGYTTPHVTMSQHVSHAYDRLSPQSQSRRYSEARNRVNGQVAFSVPGVPGASTGEQLGEQHALHDKGSVEPNRTSPPGSPQAKRVKRSIHESSSSFKKQATSSRELQVHLQNFVGRVDLPTYTQYAKKLGRGVSPLLRMPHTQHRPPQCVQGENSSASSFSKKQPTSNHLVVNSSAPLAEGVIRMPYSYPGSWSPNELANASRNRFNTEQVRNRTEHLNYMGYIPNQPRPIREFPARFSAPGIFQSSNSQCFPPRRWPCSSVATGFQGRPTAILEAFQMDSTSTTEGSVSHLQTPSTSQLVSTAQGNVPQESASYVHALDASSAPRIVSVKSEYESACQCTSSAGPTVSIKSEPSPEVPCSFESIKLEREPTNTYAIHDLLCGIKVELNSEKNGNETAFIPYSEHKKSMQTQTKFSSDRGRCNSVYRYIRRAIACIPLVGSNESANS